MQSVHNAMNSLGLTSRGTKTNGMETHGEGPKSNEVDVLIVGAGPAGLMAAATLARYGNISVRIVDKRSTKVFVGQADGLNPRSLEILQALDIGTQLFSEVNELGEICFWNPDEEGKLSRTGRIPDTIPGISRFHQSVVHQGRIERMFLDKIALWSTPAPVETKAGTASTDKTPQISVERAVCPDQLTLPPVTASALSSDPSSRIVVRLRHLTAAEAKPAQFSPHAADGLYQSNLFEDDARDAEPKGLPAEEVVEEVRARYIIGCDGARSWTRGRLGFKLEGESTDFFWGVVDGIPATDFPDIRMRCAIHSASSGSLMVIPRENNIVRLYIQIPQPPAGQRPNRADVTPEKLLNAANKIMSPFKVEIPKIIWFTCYEIGQRLADQWVWNDRVFMAGDSCHTHSPKAGQGMNIAMADAFNLTWKLASVIQGKSSPSILSTYHPERAEVANALIEFDHKFSRLFSGKPAKDVLDQEGVSLAVFKEAFEKGNEFSSGTSVDYADGILVSRSSTAAALARNLLVGPRLKSFQVVCLADARPYQTGDLIPADGRWRIFIFAGDVVAEPVCKSRLESLATFLGEDKSSPLVKYTKAGEEKHAVIEVLTVLSGARVGVEPDAFHDILRPKVGVHGFNSHYKIFADDESYHSGHGKAYENYGIDAKVGCVVIVRPDQYVSKVTDVDDHQGIADFFDGFMLVR